MLHPLIVRVHCPPALSVTHVSTMFCRYYYRRRRLSLLLLFSSIFVLGGCEQLKSTCEQSWVLWERSYKKGVEPFLLLPSCLAAIATVSPGDDCRFVFGGRLAGAPPQQRTSEGPARPPLWGADEVLRRTGWLRTWLLLEDDGIKDGPRWTMQDDFRKGGSC